MKAEILFISWRKRLYYSFVAVFHWALRKRVGKSLFREEVPPPKRILICNLATLGDVFLSTFVIPAIKQEHPNCEIGLLISPTSKMIAEGCPGVDHVHLLKPWLQVGDSFLKKLEKFFRFHLIEKKKILKEIIPLSYDWAINFYPFLSDVVLIFLQAKIPVRVGFDALGYRTLFSHLIPWEEGKYLTHHYWKILETLGISNDHKPHFVSPWTQSEYSRVPEMEKSYVLFHTCSADALKDLSADFWRGLHAKFQGREEKIYFTGKGEDQHRFIQSITSDPSDILCNELNWEELIRVVLHAKLILSVDTVLIHLAAAVQVPFIVLYQKTPDPDLWRPESANGLAFVKREEKLFRRIKRRDENLIWVEDFDPDEVYKRIDKLI